MVEDDFLALCSLRKKLQVFCDYHVASVLAFSFDDGLSFKLTTVEESQSEKSGVRHLTSSATCFESLLGCPDYFYSRQSSKAPKREDIKSKARGFAEAALLRPASDWKSDHSGDVYCRCRTLPLVIDQLGEPTKEQSESIKKHIAYIFKQISSASNEVSRFAIGERDNKKPGDSYPPNAYHSYWSLATFYLAKRKNVDTGVSPRSIDAVLLWAKMKLGTEIALHSADSSLLDSDQLAWATIIFIAFQDSLKASLAEQDLVRQAFRCLFKTQTESGLWRHYQPLFHYRKSGNAYCYNYETFAALLNVTLARHRDGAFFLDSLRPHLTSLTRLFEYAERSRQPIEGTKCFGWDSGHRSNNSDSESWATASVYLFAQGLRRCVGIWTRSAAMSAFQSVAVPDPAGARTQIEKRGDSWSIPGRPTVCEQLQTLFVNPFMGNSEVDVVEPDACPIAEDQARSAILFGPPGTSKTTLARAVAGQLGWGYVELHSSHFVVEGIEGLQKVADRIFGRLMQLDHAVILFDEVDELVHTRETGSDQPSRFLTTSMLPRLAELWKLGKVIYFINTNYITYFDSAITRSQRFDALIFVPPQSFEAKKEKLLDLIKKSSGEVPVLAVTQKEVDDIFGSVCKRQDARHDSATIKPEEGLAKFKLIRWDQLREVAERLLDNAEPNGAITAPTLLAALNQTHDAELEKVSSYVRFDDGEKSARRDYERVPVYEIDAGNLDVNKIVGIQEMNQKLWLKQSLETIERTFKIQRVSQGGKLALQPLGKE